MASMTIRLQNVDDLNAVVDALSTWQRDGAPVQLHPGDLGWHWRFGAEQLAGAIRVWHRDGRPAAIGFLDGPGLIRMAIAPAADDDGELAAQVLRDLSDPTRGVLPAGEASVEARSGTAFRALLRDQGWVGGEPWIPLHRPLARPVEDGGLRVETVGPDRAQDWLEVVRVAFGSRTTDPDRWHTLAGSPLYHRRGCCLLGYDGGGVPVAAVAVWSAGRGRPGLLEPMGVHSDHRRHGHGRAITIAAAATLRAMGSSSARVATPGSNRAAVATYASAGFEISPEVTDFHRKD